MGNCKSCLDSVSQTATIIDSNGRLRQFKVPITAAEIMLDELGHVIASEQLIRRTRRVTVMKADEELRPGNIYLLVPSARANSRVSKWEMEIMDNAKGNKRRRCKILPTETGGKGMNGLALENETEFTITTSSRVSNSCSWRPALDPIFEENNSFRLNCKPNRILAIKPIKARIVARTSPLK